MASAEAKSRWFPFSNHHTVDEDHRRASNDLMANTKWWFNQQHKLNSGSFWNPQWETFPTSMQNDENARIQEVDALQKKIEFDHYKHIVSDEPNKLLSELESQWIGIKKNEPWWRTADLDDFVSQKSLEHFDNCDLPLPRTNKKKWLVCEQEKSTLTDFTPRSPTSIHAAETHCTSGVIGCSSCGLDRPFSTMQSDETENLETPNSELSKTQLLDALCHSQRRAREAETAAQQACNQKEHVIELFLRQASQIFAYKQCLHILQLESLCLQLRHNKFQPPFYMRFPDITKVKIPKMVHKATNRKLESFGSFLWGLALVGAGVLLGWTLGWLFPAL